MDDKTPTATENPDPIVEPAPETTPVVNDEKLEEAHKKEAKIEGAFTKVRKAFQIFVVGALVMLIVFAVGFLVSYIYIRQENSKNPTNTIVGSKPQVLVKFYYDKDRNGLKSDDETFIYNSTLKIYERPADVNLLNTYESNNGIFEVSGLKEGNYKGVLEFQDNSDRIDKYNFIPNMFSFNSGVFSTYFPSKNLINVEFNIPSTHSEILVPLSLYATNRMFYQADSLTNTNILSVFDVENNFLVAQLRNSAGVTANYYNPQTETLYYLNEDQIYKVAGAEVNVDPNLPVTFDSKVTGLVGNKFIVTNNERFDVYLRSNPEGIVYSYKIRSSNEIKNIEYQGVTIKAFTQDLAGNYDFSFGNKFLIKGFAQVNGETLSGWFLGQFTDTDIVVDRFLFGNVKRAYIIDDNHILGLKDDNLDPIIVPTIEGIDNRRSDKDAGLFRFRLSENGITNSYSDENLYDVWLSPDKKVIAYMTAVNSKEISFIRLQSQSGIPNEYTNSVPSAYNINVPEINWCQGTLVVSSIKDNNVCSAGCDDRYRVYDMAPVAPRELFVTSFTQPIIGCYER